MMTKFKLLYFSFLSFLIFTTPLSAQQKIDINGNNEADQSATLPNTKEAIQKVLSSPEQIRISENYGSIKEAWSSNIIPDAENKLMVIHIQDAHCNYEAQSNISQVLDNLMKEYPDQIKLIAVEGSVGIIDTSPFAEFSDKEIKKEVADYFMKKGKITGPELLSITGNHKFTIYGIETKELYDKNYKAFLDSLPFRDESEKYCGYLQNILSQIKQHVYNNELKEFDSQLGSYQEGDTSFLDYVDILKKWADGQNIKLDEFSNYGLLQKAQGVEKGIDFNVVDRERTRLIDKLGNVMGKQELSDLVLKSLHFRLGKLTAAEYYNYLKDIVEKQSIGIKKEEYPNLLSYIDYVEIHNQMDKSRLFDECAQIENRIAENMFKDENQRKLFTLSKHVGILRRMFKLELVKEDYQYYKINKQDFIISSFLSFIKVHAPRFGISFYEEPGLSKIDENLPVIEDFYEAAIERDPVLINNMLSEMKNLEANVCVLVTGGFHTRGITDILKDRQIAYAVVSPRITKKQEYNPYIDIMTNKKTPFEEFLEQLGTE